MPPEPTLSDPSRQQPVPFVFRLRQMGDKADVEGRPIDETAAPEALRAGVEMKMVRCPYKDVRQDHPRMNLSALRQMMRHWPESIAELAAIRGAYAAWAGVDARLELLELCRVAHIMETLPAWLAMRPVDPVPATSIPVRVGVVHKVAIGAAFTINLLYFLHLEDDSPVSRARPLTEQIHELANVFSILAVEEEACAGPPAQIDEALAAMIDTPAAPATRSASIGDGLPDAARFAANSFTEMVASIVFTSVKLTAIRELRDALVDFAGRAPDADVDQWISRAATLSDDLHVPTFSCREAVQPGDWIVRNVVEKTAAEREAIWDGIVALIDGFAGVPHAGSLRAMYAPSPPTDASRAAARAVVEALPFTPDAALAERVEAILAAWHRTEGAFVAALQAVEDDVGALLAPSRAPSRAPTRLDRAAVLARYPTAPADLFQAPSPGARAARGA